MFSGLSRVFESNIFKLYSFLKLNVLERLFIVSDFGNTINYLKDLSSESSC